MDERAVNQYSHDVRVPAAGSSGGPGDPPTEPVTSGAPKAEEVRRQAAELLDQGARIMRQNTPANDRLAYWSRRTGALLGQAAKYLRERSAQDISRDARRWVSENPAPVLGAAAAAGFLVGVAIRRR